MVGLERFNDLWDYAIKPLMPDRSKVRYQTKRDTGLYAVRIIIEGGPIPDQLSARDAGTVQTRYRVPGTRGNLRCT